MSTSDPLHQTQDIHDQLVAYLDGELDAETARRVDDLLSTDPVVRKEIAQLDATWNLLERLPRTELGEDFTRSTLEMVAQQAQQELKQQEAARPVENLRLVTVLLVGMFLAGFLGVFMGDYLSPNQNDVLLEHLSVLQNLNELEQITSFEYLEELRKARIFEDMTLPPGELPVAGSPAAANPGEGSRGGE